MKKVVLKLLDHLLVFWTSVGPVLLEQFCQLSEALYVEMD